MEELSAAPPARDDEEAYRLLCDTLNKIEDMHSGVEFNISNYTNDGRMYPPLKDSRRKVSGRNDVIRYRNKGHNTYISSSGAIKIYLIEKGSDSKCILDKAGLNGEFIDV